MLYKQLPRPPSCRLEIYKPSLPAPTRHLPSPVALTEGKCLLYVSVTSCIRLQGLLVIVPSLRRVRLFATPRTAARQASLSITNPRSLPKLKSIELVMPPNHLILCHPIETHWCFSSSEVTLLDNYLVEFARPLSRSPARPVRFCRATGTGKLFIPLSCSVVL